ncbi:MAG: hypothetical protein LBC64_00530 [Fibromonadaceae bacterium]|nr:hypothetical protein [Fibromonadaceae bacterium]
MIDEVTKKMKHLSRYTSITDLLCMLQSKKLHFSNPEGWEDRTDAAFLKKYEETEKKKVRVLCFSDVYDKHHFWKIYAKHGCMIKFDREKLFNKIKENNNNLRFKEVKHIRPKYFRKNKKDLPFIKQFGYEKEKEYRLVWKGDNVKDAFIPLDLEAIEEIIISGDIKKELVENLKEIVYKITDEQIAKEKITHSKIYENEEWIKEINSTIFNP